MLVAFRFNQIAIQLMPTEFLVKIFAPHVFATPSSGKRTQQQLLKKKSSLFNCVDFDHRMM